MQNMWKTVSENLCLLLSHGQGLRCELASKKPTLNNLETIPKTFLKQM